MHTSSVMLCSNKKENESVEEDGESERVATSFNKTSANWFFKSTKEAQFGQ